MKSMSLRFFLRQETQELHQNLDNQIGALDTMDGYKDYIRGITAFRGAVEPALKASAMPAWFDDWTPTYIGAEAEGDLADLGLASVQQTSNIGPFKTPSALLGALYVIEGSTLGARLLYKRAQALGFSSAHGARHLHAQTSSERAWPRFQALLDGAADPDRGQAAEAASDTFLLASWAFEAGRQ
jgi:heme oxygenase